MLYVNAIYVYEGPPVFKVLAIPKAFLHGWEVMGKRLDEAVTLNHNSMVAQLSCLPIIL